MVKPCAWALGALTLAATAQAAGPAQSLSPAPAAPSAVSGTGHAGALSRSAQSQDLPLLPASPKIPALANPPGWETFTVVTLLSAPFTALWCGLLAGIAETIIQRRIPPKFGTPQYEEIGAAAGAVSVGIAVFSLNWGPARRTPDPAARRAEVRPSAARPSPHAAGSHGA